MIFVEHEKLTTENELLKLQLNNYVNLTNELNKINSLQKDEINEYQTLSNLYCDKIKSLNKEIKKKNNLLLGWKIGGITVSVGLLLFLLLK